MDAEARLLRKPWFWLLLLVTVLLGGALVIGLAAGGLGYVLSALDPTWDRELHRAFQTVKPGMHRDEVIKLLGRQMCHLIIRKAAQDQIHFAHPAMPCAEQEPATANVQRFPMPFWLHCCSFPLAGQTPKARTSRAVVI